MGDPRRTEELTVITKAYDSLLWSCNHTGEVSQEPPLHAGREDRTESVRPAGNPHPCEVHQAAAGVAGASQPRFGNPSLPDAARQGLAVPRSDELRLRS